MQQIDKVDENTIKITRTVEDNKSYEDLLSQKQFLEQQRDEHTRGIGHCDARIAEIDALLAECTRLEVVSKEVIKEREEALQAPIEEVLVEEVK